MRNANAHSLRRWKLENDQSKVGLEEGNEEGIEETGPATFGRKLARASLKAMEDYLSKHEQHSCDN